MAPYVEIVKEETRKEVERQCAIPGSADGIWHTVVDPRSIDPNTMIGMVQKHEGWTTLASVKAGDVRVVEPKKE